MTGGQNLQFDALPGTVQLQNTGARNQNFRLRVQPRWRQWVGISPNERSISLPPNRNVNSSGRCIARRRGTIPVRRGYAGQLSIIARMEGERWRPTGISRRPRRERRHNLAMVEDIRRSGRGASRRASWEGTLVPPAIKVRGCCCPAFE